MSSFSPNDPLFLENPFPFYELGRPFSPLQIGPPGLWSVFSYDECTAILRDNATWSSSTPNRPTAGEGMAPSMLTSDPPVHSRLRSLVSQAFTPRMIDQLEPRIRQVTRELLDEAASQPEIDLVDVLANPLPVIMIAEILGIPPSDRAQFRRWSDEVIALLGSGLGGEPKGLTEGTFEAIRDYFTDMAEERRARPREDLISGLVAAEVEGSKLTFPELLQMLVLLLVAGNETTTNLISNTVLSLMDAPGELAKLRACPALLPSAIEETLRFNSPVQATIRNATRDAQVGGKVIPQGEAAVVWIAAANRDPNAFPDPSCFNIERTPNRHLAFGLGIHFCLGAPLARMEARVGLEEFLARTTSFQRSTQGPLPRVPTFIMRGVRELPLAVEYA